MRLKMYGVIVGLSALLFSLADTRAQDPQNPQESKPLQSEQNSEPPLEGKPLDPSGEQPAPDGRTLFERGQVLMPGHPLLVKMAKRQEEAQRKYKSVSFDQKAVVERFKPREKLEESEEVTKHREIVAHYEPDGDGQLKVLLVSDSDTKAFRKYQEEQRKFTESGRRQNEKNRKSLAQKLISPLLFPMTMENVQHCKFTVLLSLPSMVLLRFEPEVMRTKEPIFAGRVFVDPRTGDIYRLVVDQLYNFERIDGKFKHLKEFEVAITYTPQFGDHRFPTYMEGTGYAKVMWIKGYFQFQVSENNYSDGKTLTKEVAQVTWETLKSWSGTGPSKTENLELAGRVWRVQWKTTGQGMFQIFADEGEGTLIGVLAQQQGDASGTSSVLETSSGRVYLVINSVNIDWSIEFQASQTKPGNAVGAESNSEI